jgi:lysophospholipase L1-like esterase
VKRLALYVLLALLVTPACSWAQNRVITFAGDSIMVGTSASQSRLAMIGRLTNLQPTWFVQNYSYGGASISGEVFAGVQIPAMDATAIANLDARDDVILLGVNDWSFSNSLATFQTNYTNLLNTLAASPEGAPKIICVTPIWNIGEGQPNANGNTLADFRTAITNVCTAAGYPVINGLPLVPNNAANFVDGTHPNDVGYSHYAPNLAAALGPLL